MQNIANKRRLSALYIQHFMVNVSKNISSITFVSSTILQIFFKMFPVILQMFNKFCVEHVHKMF